MPDQKPKQDDEDFRHLIALLKSQFRKNPQHEKTMREILIRRDLRHSRDVLEAEGKFVVASEGKVN